MAKSIEGSKKYLSQFAATREYFFTDQGAPLPEGYHLTNPDFAQTLELIAEQGIAPFYGGSIGKQLIRDASGGIRPPCINDNAGPQSLPNPFKAAGLRSIPR